MENDCNQSFPNGPWHGPDVAEIEKQIENEISLLANKYLNNLPCKVDKRAKKLVKQAFIDGFVVGFGGSNDGVD